MGDELMIEFPLEKASLLLRWLNGEAPSRRW